MNWRLSCNSTERWAEDGSNDPLVPHGDDETRLSLVAKLCGGQPRSISSPSRGIGPWLGQSRSSKTEFLERKKVFVRINKKCAAYTGG